MKFQWTLFSLSVMILVTHSQTCSWQVDDFALDLTSLSARTLTKTVQSNDNKNYAYTITPCRDAGGCESSFMAYIKDDYGDCYDLASWNYSVSPVKLGDSYFFDYPNVNESNTARSLLIEYKCGSNVGTISSATTIIHGSTTHYNITIETEYACDPPEVNNCSWVSTNGHEIDLSSLRGSVIHWSDNNENETSYDYYYTPCLDGMICLQDGKMTRSMVTQTNDDGECVAYLALYDYSVVPTYYISGDEESFVFSYGNGELVDVDKRQSVYTDERKIVRGKKRQEKVGGDGCSSARQTTIQWTCDKNVDNGEYEIEYVEQIVPCVYDILIHTPLACDSTNVTLKA